LGLNKGSLFVPGANIPGVTLIRVLRYTKKFKITLRCYEICMCSFGRESLTFLASVWRLSDLFLGDFVSSLKASNYLNVKK